MFKLIFSDISMSTCNRLLVLMAVLVCQAIQHMHVTSVSAVDRNQHSVRNNGVFGHQKFGQDDLI